MSMVHAAILTTKPAKIIGKPRPSNTRSLSLRVRNPNGGVDLQISRWCNGAWWGNTNEQCHKILNVKEDLNE